MASCKEGAENDNNKEKEVYLTSSFKVRDSQYEVSLSSTHIEWTNSAKPKAKPTKLSVSVPVREVVSVKLEDSSEAFSQFTVHYITKSPKKIWKVAHITFRSDDKGLCQQWVDKLQYAANQPEFERPKNLLVIINPVSGKKKSVQDYRKIAEPVFQLADIKTTVHITDHGGQAKEIVMSCDLDSFDGILSVGGDGTYAECFNGLLTRTAKECGIDLNDPNATLQTPKLRIGVLPTGTLYRQRSTTWSQDGSTGVIIGINIIGTGNGAAAMATGTYDVLTMTLHIVAGYSMAEDMLTVHKDNEFVAFSCIIIGHGFFADSIKESESRRWMGRARYVYAMGKAFAQHRLFNCELQYLPFQEGPGAAQSASDSGLADCSQAMSEVQLEGEASTTSSGWQSVKYQSFCAVSAAICDMKDFRNPAELGKQYCDGAIYVDAVKACSRTKLFSYYFKLLRNAPHLDSLQHVDRLKVRAYRILSPRTVDGASADHFDDYMNIDGEFTPLKEPRVIEVWNHNKLMRLFGAGAWSGDEEKI